MNKKNDYIYLNWTIDVGDKRYTNVNISLFTFDAVPPDSVITLTNSVPTSHFSYPVALIKLTDCAIDVYNGNVLIYTYGKDTLQKGKFIGSGTHIIPLDSFTLNDTLIIKLYTNKDTKLTTISPLTIIPASNTFSNIIRQNYFVFCLAPFLLVFGIIGTIISLVSLFLKRAAYNVLAISQLAFWSAVGQACINDFIQIISKDFIFNTCLKYVSLIAAIVCLIAIFSLQLVTRRIQRMHMNMLFVCTISVAVVSFILHITDTIHITRLNFLYRTLTCFAAGYGIFESIYIIIKQPIEKSITAFGLLAFFTFISLDFFFYAITQYSAGSFTQMSCSCLSISTVILIICSIINYVHFLSSTMYSTAIGKLTKEVDYLDYITGTFNRKRTLETLKQFDSDKTMYVVVSISVEKKADANEQEQDIICVAKIVQRVFGCYGLVGRLDTCRFIVIAANLAEKKIIQLLFVFQELIAVQNKKSSTPLNVSFGYAFSKEIHTADYFSVYQSAEMHKVKALPDYHKKLPKVLEDAKRARHEKHTLI